MARITRIVLDLGIVSLDCIQPVVSKVWSMAKGTIVKTPAKKIIENPTVSTIETKLMSFTEILRNKLKYSRCSLLKRELEYLEEEIVKCKKKIKRSEDDAEFCGGKKISAGAMLLAAVQWLPGEECVR